MDDGKGARLYAGGSFTSAGGQTASAIAAWDGKGWSALGTGLLRGQATFGPVVNALALHDDGTGPALYAGGAFGDAGGVAVQGIARWDGARWSALAPPASRLIDALLSFNDGTGPALYAAGRLPVGVQRWDGSRWSPVGGAFSNQSNQLVRALALFDDGNGPALLAGGLFTSAGGVRVNNIARWDGSAWTPFHLLGMNDQVDAFQVVDGPGGRELYIGGRFTRADIGSDSFRQAGVFSAFVARWHSPLPPCPAAR